MNTKQVVFNLDEELIEKSEKILDGIGGLQVAITIFLNRLIKENSLMFLLPENKAVNRFEESRKENDVIIAENKEFDDNAYSPKRTKKPITQEMRNYVWMIFKQVRAKGGVINRNAIAKAISDKSGMSQGSAFIYIGILINLLNGNINKRNLKFEDLEQYVKNIKNECSARDFENTLKSLESSIPFWKEYFAGEFAYNVERLVKRYK